MPAPLTTALRALWRLFIFPGDYVCRAAGLTRDDDGALLRPFINSTLWGLVAAIIVLGSV